MSAPDLQSAAASNLTRCALQGSRVLRCYLYLFIESTMTNCASKHWFFRCQCRPMLPQWLCSVPQRRKHPLFQRAKKPEFPVDVPFPEPGGSIWVWGPNWLSCHLSKFVSDHFRGCSTQKSLVMWIFSVIWDGWRSDSLTVDVITIDRCRVMWDSPGNLLVRRSHFWKKQWVRLPLRNLWHTTGQKFFAGCHCNSSHH